MQAVLQFIIKAFLTLFKDYIMGWVLGLFKTAPSNKENEAENLKDREELEESETEKEREDATNNLADDAF